MESADSMGEGGGAWGLRAWVQHRLQSLGIRVPIGQPIPSRALYIVPTRSGLVFGGILLVMLLGALNYQNNLGLLLTFFTLAVLLMSLYHTWLNLLGVRILGIRTGPPVFCGQPATVSLHLRNDQRRRRLGLQAVIRGALSVPPRDLAPQSEAVLSLIVPTERRGVHVLPRIGVQSRAPFGFFRAWCYLESRTTILVYPRPAPRAPQPAMSPTERPNQEGAQGQGADDFLGSRPYRPGDSPRRLDWKALSRERGLVIKQFGGDRSDRIWLDWHRLPPGDPEQRLRWLCRQVLDGDQRGQSFGLRLPGQVIPLGWGPAHKHRCLEALARFPHDP